VLGFASAFAGLCLGSAVGYALGRLWPARLLRELSGELPKAPALALVLLSRPVPVLAEAISLAAGATRVPPAGFAISSALGNALYAAAMAGNGAALLPDGLAGPGLVLPMLVPVVSWLVWMRVRAPKR
jgi:membrane protein DedA with SNARE-associated domain